MVLVCIFELYPLSTGGTYFDAVLDEFGHEHDDLWRGSTKFVESVNEQYNPTARDFNKHSTQDFLQLFSSYQGRLQCISYTFAKEYPSIEPMRKDSLDQMRFCIKDLIP